MKIFVSVKYFIDFGSQSDRNGDILNTMYRNRIAMGYPKYYGSQSDHNGIS